MLIDTFLPKFHFNEVHTQFIGASPERVFQVMKEVTPDEIGWLQPLLAIRTLPARLSGHFDEAVLNKKPFLEQMLKSGFILLAEETGSELVLGTIAQFWKLVPDSSVPAVTVASPEEFSAFKRRDYAKAVTNFHVSVYNNGLSVLLSTETRIWIPDPVARLKFRAYWSIIYVGSALIRRMWLKAIKQRAEQ